MSYEQLWAPWRLAYVSGQDAPPQTPDGELEFLPGADHNCFMCRGLADHADRQNLLVHRGEHTAIYLNRYPYNNGHLLVTPRLHKARIDQLSDEEHLECTHMLARLTGLMEKLFNAEGFNVGLNLGRAAGAGVPGHLHWHLVPRWSGDTNFMPALAGIRVIPQSLDAMYDVLEKELRS